MENELENLLIEQFLTEKAEFKEEDMLRKSRSMFHLWFYAEIKISDGSRKYSLTNEKTGNLIKVFKDPVDFWKYFFEIQSRVAHETKCLINIISPKGEK